jgi:hypothetical protein
MVIILTMSWGVLRLGAIILQNNCGTLNGNSMLYNIIRIFVHYIIDM